MSIDNYEDDEFKKAQDREANSWGSDAYFARDAMLDDMDDSDARADAKTRPLYNYNKWLPRAIKSGGFDVYSTKKPIYYKNLTFDSLDELCKAYGVNIDDFIDRVEAGESIDSAFKKELELADVANIAEQKEILAKKASAASTAFKDAENAKVARWYMDSAIRDFGRNSSTSNTSTARHATNDVLLGQRRKVFAIRLAQALCPTFSTATASSALAIYNFERPFSEFMYALKAFLTAAANSKHKMVVSPEDVLKLFYSHMWVGDIPRTASASDISRLKAEPLDELLKEREWNVLTHASKDPLYDFFTAHKIPSKSNNHDGWVQELATMLGFKDKSYYIDTLIESFPIEFLMRCQEQVMYVDQHVEERGLPDCDFRVTMIGAARVEYVYDVYLKSFYTALQSRLPENPRQPIDITDLVRSLGVEVSSKRLKAKVPLWVFYNKSNCYDEDMVFTMARKYNAHKK